MIKKSFIRLTTFVVMAGLIMAMFPAVPADAAKVAAPIVKDHDAAAIQKLRKNKITIEQRLAAAKRWAADRLKQKNSVKSSISLGMATPETKSSAKMAMGGMPMPGSVTPDFFNVANWAYSPLLKKFVDSLPGLGSANANNLGQYIPVAVADKASYPGSDYYEIALVQYTEKMHTDLPATTLRGYVQLETPVNAGSSKHVALKYPNGSPILDLNGKQVFAYDVPHYLGPTISAMKNTPTRIKFTNYLPTGAGGDLFIPVDTTVMGAGMGPVDMPGMPGMKENYKQNRATLHLHGGLTPWISDGTPHQWTTPAGENTSYPKGVSVQNVPDMPDPGPGSMTFYYTNQESARLMFYHDHSYGITRLNVYAGEAAPYIVTDPTEQNLINTGVIPADQIPLVIQDRTYVDAATVMTTDPTWAWGSMPGMPMTGDLWEPHVYMPNQNPNVLDGINPFGRWDYGPWFWPVWPAVNGVKTLPDGTKTPGVPNVSMGMEAFNDTPIVNGTAYPYLSVQPKAYRFRILNAANDRFLNLQLYVADPAAVSADGRRNTEVKMIPALPGTAVPADWPLPDSRVGGLPDPSTRGPAMVQIGTEGGFLPNPVTLTNIPIGYDRDVKSITVGNVKEHNLLLGTAERADVIIDFSAFAGKTLILYNDAPAAFPAGDARQDHFTGNPDLTAVGGSPSTAAGFGPNNRTIMQIRVGAGTAIPYNATQLNTALPAAFAASQDPIIVPQAPYNAAYGGNFPTDNTAYARISDNALTFTPLGATAPITVNFSPKTIAEEFETEYGRMSGFLGVEMPFTNGLNQTTIFYGFMDPATEVVNASMSAIAPVAGDGTQLWKITHNGVDTHPVHFHLFNVQVVNRVDWAGVVKPPEPNELGWKETVRMNPLEDVIVALRPIAPKAPFGTPDSIRPLDPTMPIGSTAGFKNVDINGNPVTTVNQLTNFGKEYMWHCHILSHEEMDMMRPIILNSPSILPITPSLSLAKVGNQVNLTWTDGTPANNPTTLGNPANEIGFRIERAVINAQGNPGTYTQIGTALANSTSYTDTPTASNNYSYQVVAYNAAGISASPPSSMNVTITATSNVVALKTGWNLITMPSSPVGANGQPTTLTAESFGQMSGADVITKWLTVGQAYNSHIVGTQVNNFNLAEGQGYFAHVNVDTNVNFSGTPAVQTTPVVSTGWNLLGWNSDTPTNANSFGFSLGADMVARFNNITQQWITHVANLPINNFIINKGDGIFVHKP